MSGIFMKVDSVIYNVMEGIYDNHILNDNEVEESCDWIAENLIGKIQGDELYYLGWRNQEKEPNNMDYLQLVYGCCVHLLENNPFPNENKKKTSILKFCDQLLDYIHTNSPDNDKHYFPIAMRKGNIYKELNKRESELEIYDKEIKYLVQKNKWIPGQMTVREQFQKYSMVEILFAQKALSHYDMGDFEEAKKHFQIVLGSIKKRGIEDFINTSFPEGIKKYITELENKYIRKQSYPNQTTDDVLDIIQNLVQLKRQGKFKEASDGYSELSEKEQNDSHNYPYILKSWAKVLVCMGEYEKAIEYFEKAKILFKENDNTGESWQCGDQAITIKNRNKNRELFIDYVNAVSGGSLDYPINF